MEKVKSSKTVKKVSSYVGKSDKDLKPKVRKAGYEGYDCNRAGAEKILNKDIAAGNRSQKENEPFRAAQRSEMRFKKGGPVKSAKGLSSGKVKSVPMNKGQTDLHIPKAMKPKAPVKVSSIKAASMKYAKGGKVVKKAAGGTPYEAEMRGMTPTTKKINYSKDLIGMKPKSSPMKKGGAMKKKGCK